MNLEKNRKLVYKENIIDIPHPFVQYKKIIFEGIDDSQIEVDLTIPKSNIKGVIVDFPEFKVKNKDYLNLTKYSILGYALASLHIRGQAGNSENKTPCSHFPFVDCNYSKPYYNLVFQDSLDTIHLVEKLFPSKDIIATGLGQGAAISLVCANYFESIKELFILDCSLCDIKNNYNNNKKNSLFKNIRKFETDYPDKLNYLYETLDSIDVLNISNRITQKVHYGLSYLDPKTPIETQLKLLDTLQNVETQHYKFLDYKKIFQHQFDDYILEVLSNK